MSGKGRCVDKRIERTVAYLLRCPRLTVPEAMRACKFSDKESSNAGKQMAVRHAHEKAAGGKRIALPPNLINVPTAASTVSPMTTAVTGGTSTNSPPSTPTTPGSTRSTRSTSRDEPKMKRIRRSSQAMQKVWINKLAMSDHSKRALKRATRWYAREKEITGGLSLYEIEKK
jgi:hypothetical protein